MSKPVLSVIAPMYNEEDVLPAFFKALTGVMDGLDEPYEVICIDDGSEDKTVNVVREFAEKNDRIRLIKLSRNFGKEIAMTAGLDVMEGEAAIFIDCDLQDPPELIPEFVKFWRQGYQNVYGLRVARNDDSVAKRATAGAFYKIFNKMSKVPIPANAGDFRLLGKEAAEAVKSCRETHRFMKGLYSWVGFSSIAIPYERPPRYAGKTKFNSLRLLNFALDGIVAHSTVLLRLSTLLGFVAILASMALGLWLLIDYVISGDNPNGFYTTALVILALFSVNFIMLGVLGEYIWRSFDEAKKRPLYFLDNDDPK